MTDIPIPAGALEAGEAVVQFALAMKEPDAAKVARAAFLAMVGNWEGWCTFRVLDQMVAQNNCTVLNTSSSLWSPHAMTEPFILTEPEPPAGSKRKETPKRGHAWTPGTGPTGETCGTCQHLFRNRLAKTYLKCGLMHRQWTGGQGTDIRAKDAACKFWEPARDD